jgi:hypothetical protein
MVARRTNVAQALAAAARDDLAGDVAGRHDAVIGLRRHAQMRDLADYRRARTRRIGDEHHRLALRADPHQRVAGGGKRHFAVMHDAPDVAQEHVIGGRDGREMRDQIWQGM